MIAKETHIKFHLEHDISIDGFLLRMARFNAGEAGYYTLGVNQCFNSPGSVACYPAEQLKISREDGTRLMDALIQAGIRPSTPLPKPEQELSMLKIQRAHLDDMRTLNRGLLRKLGVEFEVMAQLPADELGTF